MILELILGILAVVKMVELLFLFIRKQNYLLARRTFNGILVSEAIDQAFLYSCYLH